MVFLMELYDQVNQIARRSKAASRVIRTVPGSKINDLLDTLASQLMAQKQTILDANARDLASAQNLAPGLRDRLLLTPQRVADLAEAVHQVRELRSPVGEVLWGRVMDNGLKIQQIRVPMGVVTMIYEARPNVTIDAACLALKTCNSIILRGGSAAACSNRALVEIIRQCLESLGLPQDTVLSLDSLGRDAVSAILKQRGLVDLAIPRGGAGLIQMVVNTATVPVIETGVGNCHVYVDGSAHLNEALNIVLNAKTQRVGVCNAAETLLVDRSIAEEFLPLMLPRLAEAGVRLHGDAHTATLAAKNTPAPVEVIPATETDWETEYLDYDIAIRVVDGVDEAIEHITTYSTGHTEAIVAQDQDVIDRFVDAVDSAVVAINASTRFTDGGEFGFGAEIGISTQKLHARGPMGLTALTTQKSIVLGHGQVRI